MKFAKPSDSILRAWRSYRLAACCLLLSAFGCNTQADTALYFNTPQTVDSFGQITKPGQIQELNFQTGERTTIVDNLNNPSGIAVDSLGNLYFANAAASGPYRVELFKRTQNGDIQSLGLIFDSSGGSVDFDTPPTTLILRDGSLYFNTPQIFHFAENTRVPGRIQKLNLETGERATIVDNLDLPSGIAIDASGNIYCANAKSGPYRVELLKRTPGGDLQNLGLLLDSSGGLVYSVALTTTLTLDGNSLYFSTPRVDSSFGVIRQSGRIVKLNLESGEQTVVLDGLANPSGIALNEAGEILCADTTWGPYRVELFQAAADGTRTSLGLLVDSSGASITGSGFGTTLLAIELPKPDSDGDGVPDAEDLFPHSDTRSTIWVKDIDSGVSNEILADGSTLTDLTNNALEPDGSNKDLVDLFVDWKRQSIISGKEMGALLRTINTP